MAGKKKKSKVKGISYGTPGLSGNLDADQPGQANAPQIKFNVGAPLPQTTSVSAASSSSASASGDEAVSEAKAVLAVLKILQGLPRDATGRVLQVVAEELGVGAPRAQGGALAAGKAPQEEAKLGYADLASFIAGAGVKSDSWRCLLVGYWFTVVEGEEDFSALDVERELAQMDQRLQDSEEAFAALLGRGFVAPLPREPGAIQRFSLTPQGLNGVWSKFGE